MQRPGERADGRRERRAAVGARRGDDPRRERRGVQAVLGGADPVGVDRLDVARIGLAAPAEEELLGRGLALGDDLVRHGIGLAVGDARRAGDDRHHLRREPAEVLARLLVGDLVQLAELPLAGQPRRLGLEVGRRVAGEPRRLVRLRIGHLRVEVVVDEQAPDLLVRVVADELLDVDAAIAERPALAVGLGDLRLEGDDAFEPWPEVGHLKRIYLDPPPPSRWVESAAVAHRVTLIPGDGTGPELTEATRRVPRGDRRRVRLGRPARRHRRDGPVRRQPAAGRRARRDPRERRRAEGADHDAGRRRLPLGQRRPAQEPRPVRAGPAVQDLSRRALALRRRRPRDRPREHRGPLRGDRVRAGHARRRGADPVDRVEGRQAALARRRHLDQADLDHGHAPHLRVRLRLRAPEWAAGRSRPCTRRTS